MCCVCQIRTGLHKYTLTNFSINSIFSVKHVAATEWDSLLLLLKGGFMYRIQEIVLSNGQLFLAYCVVALVIDLALLYYLSWESLLLGQPNAYLFFGKSYSIFK